VREAFEQAILNQPDDPSTYAAYADWLHEQGDPRGEFIQVQLALQDERRSPEERKALQERERELLDQHERAWLGELASYLLAKVSEDAARLQKQHVWRRGLLTTLRVDFMPWAFSQSLATAACAWCLQELHVYGEARYFGGAAARKRRSTPRVATPTGVHDHWELLELIGSPCLRGLRVFQMGDVDGEPSEEGWNNCHTYATGLEHVIAGMPRIEELHLLCKDYDIDRLFALPNLDQLRVLRLYRFGVGGNEGERQQYAYPVEILAANPALANLEQLRFHPHMPEYHRDAYEEEQRTGRRPSFLPLAQVRALLRSPHLPRLTHLQLRLSDMGDAGVAEIIASGILKRLKRLDLRHGCITDEGAHLLAGCPDARRLEHLDLSRNAVSAAGLAMLQQPGVPARADTP
jgi:uncharacterized protein (TIGR02996 family)